jgi:hypothetical protein
MGIWIAGATLATLTAVAVIAFCLLKGLGVDDEP